MVALVDKYAEIEALMTPGEPFDLLVSALRQRPAWMADAACREWPTEAFFPPPGSGGRLERSRGADALAVCERCPVADPCAAYANESCLQGIYGATTTRERKAFRRSAA